MYACTGFSGGFPDTDGQYGSGGAYSAGIVNGPLSGFSDQSGSLPAPFGMSQGVFSVAGTDPTVSMPANGSNSANFWMDLQVDTNPPSGASYRLWPSYPVLPGGASEDTTAYTLATEFQLSESCTLDKIWFYSASGAAALPTQCAIWSVSSQSVVSGTDNTSPSWSGAAASGWVSCAYSGVTLPAGDYKVAVFYGGGSRVVPGDDQLLGQRRPRRQWDHRRAAHRAWPVRRDEPRPEHLQPRLLGIPADLRRRQRRELLGRCRGNPDLSQPARVRLFARVLGDFADDARQVGTSEKDCLMRFPNGLLVGLAGLLAVGLVGCSASSSGASALPWVRVPFQLITGLSGRD